MFYKLKYKTDFYRTLTCVCLAYILSTGGNMKSENDAHQTEWTRMIFQIVCISCRSVYRHACVCERIVFRLNFPFISVEIIKNKCVEHTLSCDRQLKNSWKRMKNVEAGIDWCAYDATANNLFARSTRATLCLATVGVFLCVAHVSWMNFGRWRFSEHHIMHKTYQFVDCVVASIFSLLILLIACRTAVK